MSDEGRFLPQNPDSCVPFQIGEWCVEPSLNRLTRDGDAVTLQPRIMHVLVCLAAVSGRVVTRRLLLDTVWKDAVVCEDALTRTVSELRRVFGDTTSSPKYIETIRKRGYRLLVPVSSGSAYTDETPVIRRVTGRRFTRSRVLVPLACLMAVVIFFWVQRSLTATPEPERVVRGIPFTSYAGNECDPALSPDGTTVAFVWDGGTGRDFDVFIKQRDTETPLRLSDMEGDERYPAWSPSGDAVAFAGEADGLPGIFVVPAIGGPARRLAYTDSSLTGLDWSPDGRVMAYSFAYAGGDLPSIILLDIKTGDRRVLTSPPCCDSCDHRPCFSPDGGAIAFIRYSGGFREDIFLVPVSGGEARPLTTHQRWVTGMDWFPDGSRLVFSAAPAGIFCLWSTPTAVGAPVRLATPGFTALSPSVAQRKDCMIYEELTLDSNIWHLRLDGEGTVVTPPEPLIESTRGDFSPDVSRDGTKVAFVSTRSGYREIWSCVSDGSRLRRLTNFRGMMVSRPRWSPDGRWIAFSASPEEALVLCLLDVSTGTWRRLGPADQDAPLWDWSPDGKWLYYGSRGEDGPRIRRIEVESGRSEEVLPVNGNRASISGDGARMYFCKTGEQGMWEYTLETGVERCALLLPDMERWCCWRMTDEAVFFILPGPEGYQLVRYDPAGEEMRILARIPPYSDPHLTVSNDGMTILYDRTDRMECDLMLVEELS